MIIINKECLNKNNYESIFMDLMGTKFEVKIIGNEYMLTNKSNEQFSEKLVNLNDLECVNEIVDYFLRNNTINEINNKEYINDYDWYTTIKSISNRLLALKLGNNETCKLVCNSILKKYYFDRYNYCFNNDISEIDCNNYSIKYGDKLVLRSEYDEKNNVELLVDEDVDFLYKLIFNKLDYKNEAYLIEEEKNGFNHKLIYLINGDMKIKINSTLIKNYIYDIIYQYNNQLMMQEEKQLKLKI